MEKLESDLSRAKSELEDAAVEKSSLEAVFDATRSNATAARTEAAACQQQNGLLAVAKVKLENEVATLSDQVRRPLPRALSGCGHGKKKKNHLLKKQSPEKTITAKPSPERTFT